MSFYQPGDSCNSSLLMIAFPDFRPHDQVRRRHPIGRQRQSVEVAGKATHAGHVVAVGAEGVRCDGEVDTQQKSALLQLELIAIDIQRTMKDAKHIDVAILFCEVCDAIVPVQENSNVAR